MKTLKCEIDQGKVAVIVGVLFMSLWLPVHAAHAQTVQIEDIIYVYGIEPREDDYYTVQITGTNAGGMGSWADQLSHMLGLALDLLNEVEVDTQAACEQQQTEFRNSCLETLQTTPIIFALVRLDYLGVRLLL
jgi:predicted dehydrogenase